MPFCGPGCEVHPASPRKPKHIRANIRPRIIALPPNRKPQRRSASLLSFPAARWKPRVSGRGLSVPAPPVLPVSLVLELVLALQDGAHAALISSRVRRPGLAALAGNRASSKRQEPSERRVYHDALHRSCWQRCLRPIYDRAKAIMYSQLPRRISPFQPSGLGCSVKTERLPSPFKWER
jgi:hypothetical protein